MPKKTENKEFSIPSTLIAEVHGTTPETVRGALCRERKLGRERVTKYMRTQLQIKQFVYELKHKEEERKNRK